MRSRTILVLCAGIAVASLNNCVGLIAPIGSITPASAMTTATANFDGAGFGSPMSVSFGEGSGLIGPVLSVGPYEVLKPVKGDRISALQVKGDGGILARAALMQVRGDTLAYALMGKPWPVKPQIGPQTATLLLGTSPDGTKSDRRTAGLKPGGGTYDPFHGAYPDTTEGDAHPGGGTGGLKTALPEGYEGPGKIPWDFNFGRERSRHYFASTKETGN